MLLENKTNRSDQFCMVSIDLEQGELLGANRQFNVIQSKKYCGFYKKIYVLLTIHCEAHYFHLDKV